MMNTESLPPGPLKQVSMIPFRRREERVEFCLITSIRKGRWGFPKGIIDPGETPVETALKEAHEEAGLHGRIVGPPLGSYQYHKWDRDLTVTVRLMEVECVDDTWDEDQLRERRWVEASQAEQLLVQPELKRLLAVAVEQIRAG
jgi:8-oxo-dGTP pyrophosphatase MutT (NUDIX family)